MKTFMSLSGLDKLADDDPARPIVKQLLEWLTADGVIMLYTTLVAVIALCLMIPFTRMYGVIGAVVTLHFYPSYTLTLLQEAVQQMTLLGDLAFLGQSTVFYAAPNTGKTLSTLWLLIQAIKRSIIDPSTACYVDADDSLAGDVQKLWFAEEHGFHLHLRAIAASGLVSSCCSWTI